MSGVLFLVGPDSGERQSLIRMLQARDTFQVAAVERHRELRGARLRKAKVAGVLVLPRVGRRHSAIEAPPEMNYAGRPVLLVETDSATDEWLLAGIKAGATGVLPWPVKLTQVRRALALARQGNAPLTPRAAGLLIRHTQTVLNGMSTQPRLTPGEKRVARLLVEGCPNKEIAEALHLSRSTVETHVAHNFHKLAVTSRAAAAVKLARALEADA